MEIESQIIKIITNIKKEVEMVEYEKLIAEKKADSTHREDTSGKTKTKSDKSIEK